MTIVSDTSPLRYLIEIEVAEVLAKLFSHVVIPQKVFSELQGKRAPAVVIVWIQQYPNWLEVRQADISLW